MTLLERDFIKENLLDQVDALERRIRVLEETLLLPSGIVAVKYRTDAGQSISDSAVEIVDYEDKDYDTHDAVTVGASWKFTAPFSRWYRVKAAVRFAGTTAWAEAEDAQLILYKNGAQETNLDYVVGQDGSGGSHQKQVNGSDTIYLLAGETADIRVYQASGGALAMNGNAAHNYVAIESLV